MATKVKITGQIQLTLTVAAFYEAVRPNGTRIFPVSTNYKKGRSFADALVGNKPVSYFTPTTTPTTTPKTTPKTTPTITPTIMPTTTPTIMPTITPTSTPTTTQDQAMPDYKQLADPAFDIISRDGTIKQNTEEHLELDMLRQRYAIKTPGGEFSNERFLLLLRKLKYITTRTRSHTKSLISEWDVQSNNLTIDDFITKCDEIKKSLDKKKSYR